MADLKTNLEQILQEKQSKIKPENIKKDIQIFDVIGNYGGDSDVKLFETEDAMHLDETAKENDLAVIYRNETNNMVADSQFQYIIFPETVTLPIAVTESYFCMLRAADDSAMFDGQIMLSSNSFMFHGYSDTGVIDIQYDSTDGINYTRTTTITNPINLGTVANVYFPEEWNDNFGYFMQVDRSTFEGLYQYTINGRTNLFKTSFTSNISVSNENTTNWNENLDGPIYDKNKTTELIKKIRSYHDEVLETNASNSSYFFCSIKNQPVIICPVNAQGTKSIYNCKPVTVLDGSIAVGLTVYYNAGSACIGPAYSSDGYKFEIFYLNYENMTYTREYNDLISTNTFSYSTLISDIIPIRIDYDNGVWLFEFNELYAISISSTSSYVYDYITDINIYPSGYILAPSQLTLASSNELLPGKIALGKEGVVVGNESIYDYLDKSAILYNIYGLTEINISNSQKAYCINNRFHVATCDLDTKLHKFKIDNTSTSDSIGLHKILMTEDDIFSKVPEKYKNTENYLLVSFYRDKNNRKMYMIYRKEVTPWEFDLLSFPSYNAEPTITSLTYTLSGSLKSYDFYWNDSCCIASFIKTDTPVEYYIVKIDLSTLQITEIDTLIQPSTSNDYKVSIELCGNFCVYNYVIKTSNNYSHNLIAFDCETNTKHVLLNDLVLTCLSSMFDYGYFLFFEFENYVYITYVVDWTVGHKTVHYLFKIQSDNVFTIKSESDIANWRVPSFSSGYHYSKVCVEDDEKIIGIDNGVVIYKNIVNPGIITVTINNRSPYYHTWISNNYYLYQDNTINKQLLCHIDNLSSVSLNNENISLQSDLVMSIPVEEVGIYQDINNNFQVNYSYEYVYDNGILKAYGSISNVLDEFTFIPGIFDIADNDYDYIYLHTYISQGNLQSAGIIFNDSNAFSPVTDYNKALETSKEIKGIN